MILPNTPDHPRTLERIVKRCIELSMRLGALARRALLGELLARAVDVGAVELVVARDVEDVPGRGPCLGDVAHRACADRSPIAYAHEHVGAFDDRGQEVVELEMQVGDDLNAHRAPRSQECWRGRILHLRAVFGECICKVFI